MKTRRVYSLISNPAKATVKKRPKNLTALMTRMFNLITEEYSYTIKARCTKEQGNNLMNQVINAYTCLQINSKGKK